MLSAANVLETGSALEMTSRWLSRHACAYVCMIDAKLQCNICMEDFQLDESVRTLPCKHFYHPVCISTWLQLVSY